MKRPLASSSFASVLVQRTNELALHQRGEAQPGAAPSCPPSLASWLGTLGLQDPGTVLAKLKDEHVTLQSLPDVTEADLKDIGIRLGDRKAIVKAAAKLLRTD